MDKRRKVPAMHAVSGFFVFCLIGAFALLASTLVLAGVSAYRGVYDTSVSGSEQQTALSYLINKIHAYDMRGGVVAGEDGVLRLPDEVDGVAYETRIFCNGSMLCEYYCEAGQPHDAELGQPVAVVESMRLYYETPALVHVEVVCDGRTAHAHIALRTGGEGGL